MFAADGAAVGGGAAAVGAGTGAGTGVGVVRAGAGVGAVTKDGGTGTTPVMLLVSSGLLEVVMGAIEAGVVVLLRALTVLLPSPSPRTTLLNISSTFICRLLDGTCFLPFLSCVSDVGGAGTLVVVEVVELEGRGRGPAGTSGGPGNTPAPPPAAAAAAPCMGPNTDPPNLKAVW